MKPSKHNIINKIKDSKDFYIVNLLSGNADIITSDIANEISNPTNTPIPEWIEKGYWLDEKEEQKLYRSKYLEFIDEREKDEIQIFFVPTYSCNFACKYCYQDEYNAEKQELSTKIIDSFFDYITKKFNNRKKYITVFGGEPLLPSVQHKKNIEYFINKANHNKIDLAFVTNGYSLIEYIDILSKGKIREIQVTLDGTASIHDKRRFLKNGGNTFDQISLGISEALNKGFSINLRMVVDKENINELPLLAKHAIDKGWTKSSLFKTQLGRNYELHHCQKEQSHLFSRIEMYENIYELLKTHPYIAEFHKTAFSISKFLFENGELPSPLFDSCPACKTEWAFDYTGKIYSCTATVGKDNEELGTYYPEVKLNNAAIEEWQERDILAISECKSCEMQLACGGGCGSVAKNQKGNVNTADCRPIKNLLSLGIAHYFADSVE